MAAKQKMPAFLAKAKGKAKDKPEMSMPMMKKGGMVKSKGKKSKGKC